MNRITNEDHRDASESAELIEKLKDCSSRVITHVIAELQYELQSRDSDYVKSMSNEINFGKQE